MPSWRRKPSCAPCSAPRTSGRTGRTGRTEPSSACTNGGLMLLTLAAASDGAAAKRPKTRPRTATPPKQRQLVHRDCHLTHTEKVQLAVRYALLPVHMRPGANFGKKMGVAKLEQRSMVSRAASLSSTQPACQNQAAAVAIARHQHLRPLLLPLARGGSGQAATWH